MYHERGHLVAETVNGSNGKALGDNENWDLPGIWPVAAGGRERKLLFLGAATVGAR
jgi:hypothetical protein